MQQRLNRYAAIGNLETCSIVGANGSIDWCCFPSIASPSVFAGLLDETIGGHFRVAPVAPNQSRQQYVDGTNILKTVFTFGEHDQNSNTGEEGQGIVTDFMPLQRDFDETLGPIPYRAIYRRIEAQTTPVTFGVSFAPRLNYAQQPTEIHDTAALLNEEGGIPTEKEGIEPVADRSFIVKPRETAVNGTPVDTDDILSQKPTDSPPRAMYLQLPEEGVYSSSTVSAPEKEKTAYQTDGGSDISTPVVENDSLMGTITVVPGESRWIVLQYGQAVPISADDSQQLLEECISRWREWAGQLTHRNEVDAPSVGDSIVKRSALVLKLLMTQRTGAIAAAPTTSLPEEIGGTRNWDYRFNWIRDSALAVRALYRLGHAREARRYLRWCLNLSLSDSDTFDPNGVLYRPLSRMDGSFETSEVTLDHLSGYRDSGPVRVGNGADNQHQLDVYGYLADAVYEASQHSDSFTVEVAHGMRELADHVCRVWNQPDAGIWEVRNGSHHFVHSKLMCWLTLDRAISLVQSHQLNGFHRTSSENVRTAFESRADREEAVARWAENRTALRNQILERGYNEKIGSFVRSYEDDTHLDATALKIPVIGFLNPDDERVISTIETIRNRLGTGDGFIYRYRVDDGVEGDENPFVPCSYWLVEALAISGQLDEATSLYHSLIKRSSPTGLLAEEYDPTTSEHRGNYPQAFSHIGVIDAAVAIREERNRRAGQSSRPH